MPRAQVAAKQPCGDNLERIGKVQTETILSPIYDAVGYRQRARLSCAMY